MMVMNRNG
jgi:hypothetical protein